MRTAIAIRQLVLQSLMRARRDTRRSRLNMSGSPGHEPQLTATPQDALAGRSRVVWASSDEPAGGPPSGLRRRRP